MERLSTLAKIISSVGWIVDGDESNARETFWRLGIVDGSKNSARETFWRLRPESGIFFHVEKS
jgi:hypothetical protein